MAYQRPADSVLSQNMDWLKQKIQTFLFQARRYPDDLKYSISEVALLDVIIRVDKRREYFKHFHTADGQPMLINEFKMIALCVYWILKFKPITITDTRFCSKAEHIDVNEWFAFFLLWIVLVAAGRCSGQLNEGSRFLKELLYSFRFRNFTIDSLLVLAESINTETFSQK